MFNKNEVLFILVGSLVLGFSADLLFGGIIAFLWTWLAIFCVIVINVLAKKIFGFYMETDVDIKFWEIEGFGLKKRRTFKKPFAIGAVLPLIAKVILLPVRGWTWMASYSFDVRPHASRAARRHGLYNYSEMTEAHLGYIAAAGIFANLAFAVIGYLIGFTDFARLNILYAFFNMIPLHQLDGNRIFFGNIILWSFLACLVAVGILFMIFII